MFRKTSDFNTQWQQESANTIRLLSALTDDSLATPIAEGRRTLGFLAWHLVVAIGTLTKPVGLSADAPAPGTPVPATVANIVAAYRKAAESVLREAAKLDDDSLPETVSFFTFQLPRGLMLEILIRHEAHHRGQITVLMRQAGLRVPGMYGPSLEERIDNGMTVMP